LEVAKFRPGLSALIIFFGLGSAVLGGIGLTFILPIVEIAQASGDPTEQAEGIMAGFVWAYKFLNIPFTIESVVIGVTFVMGFRFGLAFAVKYLREVLRTDYVRDLRQRAFTSALDARIAYYDEQGSDEILNAIVTQTNYASKVINNAIGFIEKGFLALVFISIAFYLSPFLAVVAGGIFGVLTVAVQSGIESGYSVGDRVAGANERIQESVQAGTQGIRDVKLFGMSSEMTSRFDDAIDDFVEASVKVRKNKAGVQNLYQFIAAAFLFLIIYLALEYSSMSLASLGVFLFAMFRLSPIVSNLNEKAYTVTTNLPHLVRTEQFVEELEQKSESLSGDRPVPDRIESIGFQDVRFAYDEEEVVRGISFEVERGDFVALVGQSGAGKSTLALLLARLYEPTGGKITVNGIPIDEFDIEEWRLKIAVVRQDPFIFNETLRFNLTIGNRDVSQAEIERVCEIAQVTQFLNDLPEGYDSILGDNGVQLSGGQKQRVALARALLKDADILILDEATSDLDTNLEEKIQSKLEAATTEYTTLAIAHRLSTVRNADRIYTIEDGQITESGSHSELLERDGKYSDLYETQIAN